ncbi:type II toxin-antitoxin system PemK/MazF family toxin [Pseudanabaena sp. UWO310]|nr:type II toxin-antitoxin system PemK/MazF family toxin [Pseudanabaena sp. 'Roaring Creek']TYQ31131.1 type II toxin-antitoxin system PemK/MazF family toxin [Pseudanabaena sp. UWO310]
MNSPYRGEVWLVDLGYVAKVRPCLVVSIPALDRDRALVTLVPHTTSLRDSSGRLRRCLTRMVGI